MIFNIIYNFLNDINEIYLLNMVLMNAKLYIIGLSFYSIIYLLISYNNIYKNIFNIIFIMDIISLIVNILYSIIPDKYLFIDNLKKRISLYKN
jgi:hypothetical protein